MAKSHKKACFMCGHRTKHRLHFRPAKGVHEKYPICNGCIGVWFLCQVGWGGSRYNVFHGKGQPT